MNVQRTTATGFRALALSLSLAVIGTGCDDDITGAEETGPMQAYVNDNPSSAGAVSSEPAANRAPAATSLQYSGSLDADAQVAISADGQSWIELGPAHSISAELQASGEGADVHGEVRVPVGTYSHVRLVLDDARANVAAGSTLGGLLISATLSLRLGSESRVTIEKSIPPFEVTAGSRTRIHWTMNSHQWMSEEKAEEEEVEEEEVEQAAEARSETTSESEF